MNKNAIQIVVLLPEDDDVHDDGRNKGALEELPNMDTQTTINFCKKPMVILQEP